MEDNNKADNQEETIKNQPEQENVENKDNDKPRKEDKHHKKEKEQEKALENLQEKYDELNDKYLRLFSEFDNYRKRTAKEKLEMTKTASEGIVLDLLTILDDFERALPTMEKNDNKSQYDGVLLIYNKFKRTLQQKGLEEINAINTEFNTDEHEALTNVPVTDAEQKGKVIDVIQKGYRLNGKVIRYARVVVGN